MDFPIQQSGASKNHYETSAGTFDARNWLNPRRLTLVMWDQAFLMRHMPGESYADYDRVLDETGERGYNTLRLDPMPQLLDLAHPEKIFQWGDPKQPYLPWCWNKAGEGPLGNWLIEFMEKARNRHFFYTLSGWWNNTIQSSFPKEAITVSTPQQAAELWAIMLRQWQKRFGFDGLVYVDLANEMPYFLAGYKDRIKQYTGQSWTGEEHEDTGPTFSDKMISFIAGELNRAIGALQLEFPQLRFTASIHGDERWLDIPVQFDCLDVHFYADIDPRWRVRSRFADFMSRFYTDDTWNKEFSDRCIATRNAIAPMLRTAQRARLASFAAWSEKKGMPLTTSESWASWYYNDNPDLDWNWLLEWAEWSVEDAIEYKMWGWTPHNYCQPQFVNWKNARWHRILTDRFLRG